MLLLSAVGWPAALTLVVPGPLEAPRYGVAHAEWRCIGGTRGHTGSREACKCVTYL